MDIVRACRASFGARVFVTALVGIALAVPVSSLAPAYAAGTRTEGSASTTGLSDPVLQPVMAGAGTIAGVANMTCTNLSATTTAPVPCSDPLTFGELATLGSLVKTLVLNANPAPGWEFTGWSNCPTALADTCTLALISLTTLTSPVANFVPTDDPTAPSACDSPVPLPGTDCSAPVTAITSSPTVTADKKTKEKTAAFSFKAFEADSSGNATTTETSGATFECELVGPGQTAGFTACTSPKSYDNLGDGEYTFSVKASDTASPPNTDPTPEKFTWTVSTTPPDTLITSGPSRWVLAKSATFGLAISPAGTAKYRCSLDGSGRLCTGNSASVSFGAGTHTFAAQGSDSLGNEDPTAATRTFTMPVNNTELKGKGWTKGKGKGYYLKTFSATTKKGATLKTSTSAVKQLALVVTKGKGYGTVKVYLGKTLLKKVSLAAKRTKKKQLVNVAGFAAARSGTVKVVVASTGKKVVVEGLGIASR